MYALYCKSHFCVVKRVLWDVVLPLLMDQTGDNKNVSIISTTVHSSTRFSRLHKHFQMMLQIYAQVLGSTKTNLGRIYSYLVWYPQVESSKVALIINIFKFTSPIKLEKLRNYFLLQCGTPPYSIYVHMCI